MHLRRRKENGESQQAVQDAEASVETAKARNVEVYQIAGQLKRLRQRNHFAEDLYLMLRGHP